MKMPRPTGIGRGRSLTGERTLQGSEVFSTEGASPGARTTSFQFHAGIVHPVTPERLSVMGSHRQMISQEPSG